ncbi:hypothetical protein ABD90_16060 [Lysinibacillus fusiformis]|uniref:Uncharacterized protein n=1 Tax=Lysinibacillus sphaericus CBAM5 TaxID=1400869 RepID=W7SA35_LYSSH|nr:hypothetical protein AR327_00275 [Lysinibacillus sphaericus]EWH35081.1 hypothetical protein P799_01025 [Lysinibacillus sphaericus CBAM5]MBG9726727.1 hypothetical protein [Lysinibacillus fusiformis]AMR89823.1 hypothetical protein A1T07_06400 [Lysinibacillus sphaericus]ANA47894.1 hypothetical protein A2J09_21605 [Lysinibacillus sphaericus]
MTKWYFWSLKIYLIRKQLGSTPAKATSYLGLLNRSIHQFHIIDALCIEEGYLYTYQDLKYDSGKQFFQKDYELQWL